MNPPVELHFVQLSGFTTDLSKNWSVLNYNIHEKQTIETADDNAKHIKELEDENYHLRLENAILKKTRRLRLEEEAKSRKRESSTAYDKNSN